MRLASSVTLVTGLLFRHWASKIGALLLAAILFVFTRDEVTRAFEIPLRVVPDRERVLLTDLPDTVQVQVRGPWTRVNRLQEYDIGAAMLDLRAAQPGPLEIDRASIVMPAGVVLAGVHYDHVDLRFEPVVRQPVEVAPSIVGKPASDYRLVRVETDPASWEVRGGRSQVQAVAQIATEPLDIGGAVETIEARLGLVRPNATVRLAETAEGPPRVRVRVVVEPAVEERELTVPVPRDEPPAAASLLERSYRVRVSGPVASLRKLEQLGLEEPVTAVVAEADVDGAAVIEVRFDWHDRVPADVREDLRLSRGVVRVPLPVARTQD